jgi:hypothetical protein
MWKLKHFDTTVKEVEEDNEMICHSEDDEEYERLKQR